MEHLSPGVSKPAGHGRVASVPVSMTCICPQGRTGAEAKPAMRVHGSRHESQLRLCLEAAATFLLNAAGAETIIRNQIAVIRHCCDAAGLSQVDRAPFGLRQFLNPYAFGGLAEEFWSDAGSLSQIAASTART